MAQYRDQDGTDYSGGVLIGSGLPLALRRGPYASSLTQLTRVQARSSLDA